MSDTQGDTTRDPKTVNHTRIRNEKLIDTRNRNFEQKLLSNQTPPTIVLTMNMRIDQRIVQIEVAPQTILTPVMKEVVIYAASGGVWVNTTPP